MLITHDLGVVADMADDVVVMYGGRIVERGRIDDIYYRPEMPYTWGLLGSVPRMDVNRARAAGADPGPAAVADPAAEGLRLPPALPVPRAGPGDRCDTERPDLLPGEPRTTPCAATSSPRSAARSPAPRAHSAARRTLGSTTGMEDK